MYFYVDVLGILLLKRKQKHESLLNKNIVIENNPNDE